MTDQNMDSANEFGVSRKQETIDTLWVKYRKTLEMLNDALDKNESLTEELDDALGRNETLTEDLDDALLENRNLTADLDEHKVELDKKPKAKANTFPLDIPFNLDFTPSDKYTKYPNSIQDIFQN